MGCAHANSDRKESHDLDWDFPQKHDEQEEIRRRDAQIVRGLYEDEYEATLTNARSPEHIHSIKRKSREEDYQFIAEVKRKSLRSDDSDVSSKNSRLRERIIHPGGVKTRPRTKRQFQLKELQEEEQRRRNSGTISVAYLEPKKSRRSLLSKVPDKSTTSSVVSQ